MTKKDFEILAASLKLTIDEHEAAGRWAQAEGTADAAIGIARTLWARYPRFDRKRFLIACGCEIAAQRL